MFLSSTSESRTYIMLLANAKTGYQFVPFYLPDNFANDSAIAANCFQRTYLENTPIDQAGLLVAVIPTLAVTAKQIEQFPQNLTLSPTSQPAAKTAGDLIQFSGGWSGNDL